MLPKNRLRRQRLDRLRIFADEKHPYQNNIAKWYEFEEFQGELNARQLYKMSGKEYAKWMDETQMKKLELLMKLNEKE